MQVLVGIKNVERATNVNPKYPLIPMLLLVGDIFFAFGKHIL